MPKSTVIFEFPLDITILIIIYIEWVYYSKNQELNFYINSILVLD